MSGLRLRALPIFPEHKEETTMKKLFAFALAAVMLLSLAAAASAAGTFRVGVKQDVYGFGYLDEATGE